MMDQIAFSAGDGEVGRCDIEIRFGAWDRAEVTVILTDIDAPALSRLAEAIEDLASTVYLRHLSFVPPDKVRWIERCVEPAGGAEVAYEVALTWVEDGMFDSAGYRHPRWRRLPRRRGAIDTVFNEAREPLSSAAAP